MDSNKMIFFVISKIDTGFLNEDCHIWFTRGGFFRTKMNFGLVERRQVIRDTFVN
jgi:hypothetical protein